MGTKEMWSILEHAYYSRKTLGGGKKGIKIILFFPYGNIKLLREVEML